MMGRLWEEEKKKENNFVPLYSYVSALQCMTISVSFRHLDHGSFESKEIIIMFEHMDGLLLAQITNLKTHVPREPICKQRHCILC